MMNSHLKLTLGGAAVLSMIMVFAAGRSPSVVAEEPSFDANWREAAVAVTLATTQIPEPKVVKTEIVLPEIIAKPEELTPKLKRKLVVMERRDVCARHNMRKVQYGRRWRCKR